MIINKDNLKELKDNTRKDCELLYSAYPNLSWECDVGWNELISELSYKLEAINLTFYDKYGVKIIAEQIKEKFASLRFYYTVIYDGNRLVRFITRILNGIDGFLKKFDYKKKSVVIREAYNLSSCKTIDKKEYEDAMISKHKFTNVFYFKTYGEEPSYCKIICNHVPPRTKMVPTKNRILHLIKNIVCRLNRISSNLIRETKASNVITEYMSNEAERIIEKYERLSEKTCERCGAVEGRETDKICQTTGYITNLCDECIKEYKGQYYIGKDLYEDGKLIKKGETENGN